MPRLEPLVIGTLRLDPPLVLAPMAGYSHAAFREVVAGYGGCGLFYTEMLNSRVLAGNNPAKDRFLRTGEGDRPLVAQIAGSDPAVLARASTRLAALERFAACDFNLGCPRGTVQRYGWGAALLAQPQRVEGLLQAVRRAWPRPFLVKMRDPAAVSADPTPVDQSWQQRLERCGVDAVVFHPRRPEDLFKRPARWDRLHAFRAAGALPVIGNGDLFSPEDAVRMVRTTGCRALMVGRAALIRPWILRDLQAALSGAELPEAPHPLEVIERFLDALERHCEAGFRPQQLRLFCFWFLQNFAYGLHYLKTVGREPTLAAMRRRLLTLLAAETIPPYPCRPYLQR